MNQNGRNQEEQRHREVMERYREEMKEGKALIDRLHREAVERHQAEEARLDAMMEQLHREAAERYSKQPAPPPPEPPTVHYTELPDARPGDLLYQEWTTYRPEAGRLLAEGKEGQYVLIKGNKIAGTWGTEEDAMAEGYAHFSGQPFFVHQILEREPMLRCLTVRKWLS